MPEKIENLLVPVAVSASHIGFGTLRMEPCWISLGQAAGAAAAIAVAEQLTVQTIDTHRLQVQLIESGASLFYFADIDQSHKAYKACQYFARLGFFPGFDSGADKPLEAEELKVWKKTLSTKMPKLEKGETKGAFLKRWYQALKA